MMNFVFRSVLFSIILVFWFIAVQFAVDNVASAEEQCGSIGSYPMACRVFVDKYQTRISVSKQQTPITCWAASLSNLLSYYGAEVSEGTIVASTVGSARNADPAVMSLALHHSYITATGQTVYVSPLLVTDNFWHTVSSLTNRDIYNALRSNEPVFYGDYAHAMILVDATFVPSAIGPMPINAIVADPAPGVPPFRPLSIQELMGMYAATISVHY